MQTTSTREVLKLCFVNEKDINQTLYENENQIGLDEVGRGCLAGPVCAAAVVLDIEKVKACIESKEPRLAMIRDSKKVTKRQRVLLVPFIKELCKAHSIAFVSNGEIDQINILHATMRAMHKAIDDVGGQLDRIDRIIVDGTYFKPYLNKKQIHIGEDESRIGEESYSDHSMFVPSETVVSGDNTYISIAAASILAKTYRDDYMDTICDGKYDWKNNKGYGTPKHLAGIYKYGLSEHHRMTFKFPKQKINTSISEQYEDSL